MATDPLRARGADRRGLVATLRRRMTPRVVIAGIVLSTIGALALLSPLLPLEPNVMHLSRIVDGPSWTHPLGTDTFGRDNLARVVNGARVSLRVGIFAVAIAVGLGLPMGLTAGYWRGAIDAVLMRIADTLLVFPPILLAVAMIGVLGPGETSVIIGLGIVYTPVFARVARAKTLTLREAEYIQAAQALGASDVRIIARHILPNALGPLLVQITVAFAYSIIAEAGLSFLGLGTQPPTPSWGTMLAEARPYIQQAPWYPLMPGAVLSIVVLSITIIGDWVREVISPKASR